MEMGSEGEGKGQNNNNDSSSKKPKRQMKTPFQLGMLEKTYSLEMYPSEATRAKLSEQLKLTDRQLQMWFCHRRLKDKKEGMAKKPINGQGPELPESPRDNQLNVHEPSSDHGSGSRSRSESRSRSGSDTMRFDHRDGGPVVDRSYEMSSKRMIRRVVDCVEAQLGEPLREDAPALGMEFDELPPGAFGTPIVVRETQDTYRHSYDRKVFDQADVKPIKAEMRSLQESGEPSMRSDPHGRVSYFYDSSLEGLTDRKPYQANIQLQQGYDVHRQVLGDRELGYVTSLPMENAFVQQNEVALQMSRKRKSDEALPGREVQANEKRIQKELEKQDLLRRKREEQMRKEMERQDRERRKEEERMMRERQRQEERFQREEKRENERREKFMQREYLKAERRRQKEEIRREKEAARMKVALEKATARKIAKESMELIEDERLELLELAASRKGFASIVSLDHDTLQTLDSFRDSLCAFPPKSLQAYLKKPFAIHPWIDSEDNVGNLLMVWRFCMTFSDVLGLWPFTLDEFIQALHDYDSRLLGEVHIALLRVIIKDIEDVARTPSGGSGTNQYTIVNPEGGHPQIVEGAYIWGFDIRNWLKHLNPLTWPEILRQLSLSAGFGPQMKKDSVRRSGMPENDEGKGCEDIISMLRNGSAAQNAATAMQEKGFNLQRKSRHRLTPGTVKFAAYHVLCLEGNKGLNVLDIAEKIQKFGLRDLTTSKTPDASISVALSRDPILFERIAPSTYCVRPAFRKDPANAEEFLSAAREKIQKYANGFLSGDNADDVEKDDDFECDVADGPELDDLGTPSTLNKSSDLYNEGSTFPRVEKDELCDDVALDMKIELDKAGVSADTLDQGNKEIDESNSGEPWVQGLAEGEYSDLCVEERLNALAALTGIANEGNTIRAVLEDRLDAATALRKQMWAEAQLDKKRMKEESIAKFHDSSFMVAEEGSQSPLRFEGPKNDEELRGTAVEELITVGAENARNHPTAFLAERSLVVHEPPGQTTPPIQNVVTTAERSRSQLKAFIGHRAEEMYVYRSLPLGLDRRRNRYWQFVASTSRHDPGAGRIFVELQCGQWRLIDSEEGFDVLLSSLDTRGVRESHLFVMLQQIELSFKENVRRNINYGRIADQNGNSGRNEAGETGSSPPVASEESPSSGVCVPDSDPSEPSSSFRIELGKHESEIKNALKRYHDLEIWMWKECFDASTLLAMTYGAKRCTPLLGICEFCHGSYMFEQPLCPLCHRTFTTCNNKLTYPELPSEDKVGFNPKDICNFDSSHPLRIRLIKALLTFLEASVPSEALQSSWTGSYRKAWGSTLNSSSSTGDLLQILTQFESVIKRDCLSSDFETSEELLASCSLSDKVLSQPPFVPELPWIPKTTAAVSLRLLEIDSSISYIPEQKSELQYKKEAEDITKFPMRYTLIRDIGNVEATETEQGGYTKEEKWVSIGGSRGSSGRKQTVRARGGGARSRGRLQKRVGGAMSISGKHGIIRNDDTLSQVVTQQTHGRGPRTIRKRRDIEKAREEPLLDYAGESRRNFEWDNDGDYQMEVHDANNFNSDEEEEEEEVEASEYDDAGVTPNRYGVENGGSMYDAGPNGNEWTTMEMSEEEDVEDAEEENGFEEYDENLEGDVGMNNNNSDANGDLNDQESSDSYISGEYSD